MTIQFKNTKQNEPSDRKIFKLIDPFLAVGVAFSVALSLFLLLIGVDKVDSLIVGLIATTISLVIDLVARFKDSERRILQAVTLLELIMQDNQLPENIQDLVNSYLLIKQGAFEIFKTRGDDILAQCISDLRAMADGYMIVEPGAKYAFGKLGIELAKKSIKAVSCTSPESWSSSHSRSAVEAHADAVQRGVDIIRVFIQDEKTHSDAEEVLTKQLEAGINVFVVSPDELPAKYQTNYSYFIIDNAILAEFYLTLDGHISMERVSIKSVEVNEAINRFNFVLRRSTEHK
jgi:hypothetical protein